MKPIPLICFAVFLLASCSTPQKTQVKQPPTTQRVHLSSTPEGARVILNGRVICQSTPADVEIPLNYVQNGRYQNLPKLKLVFEKKGYEQQTMTLRVIPEQDGNTYQYGNTTTPYKLCYQHSLHCSMGAPIYLEDPTIPAGEAKKMVTRDNPGGTALERTIIRWYFDSEPRGARIFWRVISSIPDQVKNTNELYLGTTPFEETRSFNILGLTYENSRDVQIEIKVCKPGYMDQTKRFNVRQALDQQEISAFYDLILK